MKHIVLADMGTVSFFKFASYNIQDALPYPQGRQQAQQAGTAVALF